MSGAIPLFPLYSLWRGAARTQVAFCLAFAVPLCQVNTNRTKNLSRISFPKVSDYHHNIMTSLPVAKAVVIALRVSACTGRLVAAN